MSFIKLYKGMCIRAKVTANLNESVYWIIRGNEYKVIKITNHFATIDRIKPKGGFLPKTIPRIWNNEIFEKC